MISCSYFSLTFTAVMENMAYMTIKEATSATKTE
jgi:hypothetical protein